MFLTKFHQSALFNKLRTQWLSASRRKVHKWSTHSLSNETLSSSELESIERNVRLRKGHGNVEAIREIVQKLEANRSDNAERSVLLEKLHEELGKLPNSTHPDVLIYGDEPKLLRTFNDCPTFSFKPLPFSDLARKLNLLRMDHLGNFTGHKSYYLMSTLAELEHALIQYALDEVSKHNFELISVPDILPAETIEACGMATSGERTQVYKLSKSNKCLSGTSEMALAGYFANTVLDAKDLPRKLTAVSRCFRAETSGLQEEKGIYRVHQFTKVEMFSVCAEDKSDEMLEHFNEIELHLFEKLGLHFKLLDMPAFELGAPAYRKYDIEAWMPGRNMWGEISSCSNCTDYQTKRLNIRYKEGDEMRYAHTINGTACAVPRLLIALLESNQSNDGTIHIPKPLQKFLRGQEKIIKRKILPDLKLVKSIPSTL